MRRWRRWSRAKKNTACWYNTAPIGIVVTQDGVLKLVNPRVLSMTGYSELELTSGSLVEMVHPDDRAMVMSIP